MERGNCLQFKIHSIEILVLTQCSAHCTALYAFVHGLIKIAFAISIRILIFFIWTFSRDESEPAGRQMKTAAAG